MNPIKAKAARLGGLLALVLGAAALLALPAIGTAKDRHHDGNGDRGARHNEAATGTIASFDATSGKLTIALTGGETLAGLVDSTTRLRCEGVEHHRGDRHLMSHGGSGSGEPGDDSGGQGNEPGDDNGGHGEEPGDDNGGQGEEPGDDNGGASGVDNSGPGSSGSGPGPSGQGGGRDNANCTTAALVPGAVVQEAEVRAEGGVATFEEVELAHTR
jgi:hypothetical protein